MLIKSGKVEFFSPKTVNLMAKFVLLYFGEYRRLILNNYNKESREWGLYKNIIEV